MTQLMTSVAVGFGLSFLSLISKRILLFFTSICLFVHVGFVTFVPYFRNRQNYNDASEKNAIIFIVDVAPYGHSFYG